NDDLVSGADAEGFERQAQGVVSAADADRVGDAEVARGFGLEAPNGFAENEIRVGQYAIDGGSHFIGDGRVLRLEIDERDNDVHRRILRPTKTIGRSMFHQSRTPSIFV